MSWLRRLRIWIFGCPECGGSGRLNTIAGSFPCVYCNRQTKKEEWR
jgi:primosomal protein N'